VFAVIFFDVSPDKKRRIDRWADASAGKWLRRWVLPLIVSIDVPCGGF
jgi:hypothetical protein